MKNLEFGIRIMADGRVAVVEAGKVTTSLKQISGGAKEAEQSASAVSTALSKIGHYGAAYLGVTQVINFAGALSQAALAADRLNNTLKFSTGSAQAGAAALEYVREVSNRLGTDLGTAGMAFAKFAASAQGTNLGMKDIKAVFEGVSKASVVLGLSAEESNGAMLALSQMMSKGTVQAEELRGQLGERIPGAFNIAARAMGVTTAELGKMLEQGQVISEDFLPKFAAEMERTFGAAASEAANSAIANVNRLNSAWEQFKRDMGQATNAAGRPQWLIDGLIEASATMREATKDGHALLGVLASLTGFFAGASGGGKFSDDSKKRRAIAIQEELQHLQSKPKNSLAFDTEKQDLERVKELQQELQGIFAQGKLKLPSVEDLKTQSAAQLERARKDLETASKFSASWAKAYENNAAKKTDAISKLDALYMQETTRFSGNQEKQLQLAADYAAKRAQIDKQFADKGQARITSAYHSALDDLGGQAARLDFEISQLQKYGEAARSAKVALMEFETTQGKFKNLPEPQKAALMARAGAVDSKAADLSFEKTDQAQLAQQREDEARYQQEKRQTVLESSRQLEDETKRLNASLISDDKARAYAQLDLEKEKWLRIISLASESDPQRRVIEEDYAAWLASRTAEITKQTRTPMQQLADQWAETTKQMQQASADWLNSGTEMLINFAKTGKLEFGKFAMSVIEDLMRIQGRKAMAGMFSMMGFADGGIMSSSGPVPLRAYASGGIASSPQLALFGEGSMNEAYVPLPDGRRIPVKLEGQAAGAPGNTYNVSVAVDASGSRVQGDAGNASELGRRIEGAVRRVLVDEKRPGGLLAS